MSATLPTADTRPTDERAGESISAHRANCPFCGRGGTVAITIQLCDGCGRWFEAIPSDEGASHNPTKDADEVDDD